VIQLYVSSISSVIAHKPSSLIPEEVISDDSAPVATGYAESKYVSEFLLDHASRKLSLNTAIARVGQVAGPSQSSGTRNKSEWLPSLVLSSLHLRHIPDSVGTRLNNIDWVPVDKLAEVIVELAFSRQDPSGVPSSELRAHVFHPLNLHPTT